MARCRGRANGHSNRHIDGVFRPACEAISDNLPPRPTAIAGRD